MVCSLRILRLAASGPAAQFPGAPRDTKSSANPNFSARPKKLFRRRSLICGDLRRVRELPAQIVLFGDGVGVGFGVGIVSVPVSKSVSELVKEFAGMVVGQ